MSVVLDCTLAIQRDPQGHIANVIWFLYGLPDTDAAPQNALFLSESFGRDSPQMVAFELDGEEYAVYADWQSANDRPTAVELREFYKLYGHVLLAALKRTEPANGQPQAHEWLVPVQYHDNYMAMAEQSATFA